MGMSEEMWCVKSPTLFVGRLCVICTTPTSLNRAAFLNGGEWRANSFSARYIQAATSIQIDNIPPVRSTAPPTLRLRANKVWMTRDGAVFPGMGDQLASSCGQTLYFRLYRDNQGTTAPAMKFTTRCGRR